MPYIYIVHCKQHINSSENVYKIGKTVDFDKRLSGYVKGSIPILNIFVKNHDEFEKQLIILLLNNTQIKQRKDCGNEYFEGNIEIIINIIMENFNKNLIDYCYKNNEDIKKYDFKNRK